METITIFESSKGEMLVSSRKSGETSTSLTADDLTRDEEVKATRWVKLKEAVFMDDPSINDLLEKIEILMRLKQ